MTKKVLYIGSLNIFLLLTVFFLFKNSYLLKEDDILSVYFFDVGQGDSILIEAPNGNQLLIDAGINSKAVEEVGKKLKWFDKNIDAILITHPDEDHIGGFPSILTSYSIDYLLLSDRHEDNNTLIEIKKKGSQQNAELVNLKRGDKIILDIDRNIYLDVLFPDDNFVTADKNETSIIFKLVYYENSFLFTGDAPRDVEGYLISLFGNGLESDVLKVGHHGSNTSTSDQFLGFVKAKYGVISAGSDNPFGHPHQEVLNSMINFKVHILETKDLGTINMKSNGREIWIEN